MSDPFTQMRALQNRIAKLASEMGLDLATLEFVPHENYGNLVHFVVRVKPETLKTNEEIETDAMRDEFDSLMGSFEVVEGDDGPTLEDVEKEEEPADPALEEAERKMQERARERARQALMDQDEEE